MKVVITGVGGFVGSALARRLIKDGYQVTGIARGDYPVLVKAGVNLVRMDLSLPSAELDHAISGAEAIFHVAAKVDMWGKEEDFYNANVIATRNIIDACKRQKVGFLVYTSSPSVIADGSNLCGVDESYPYPENYLAFYPKTKAIAEKEVLAANSEQLKTISLRPHLIWGEGDTNLIPTVVNKAKAGKLFRIGDGKNLVDFTYIDDCVEAHVLAYGSLKEGPEAAGKAFFISQGDPVPLWWWVDQILGKFNLPPIKKSLPFRFAYCLATLAEFITKFLAETKEPLITKFLVKEMATSHYFNIEAAKKILKYSPSATTSEILEKFKP